MKSVHFIPALFVAIMLFSSCKHELPSFTAVDQQTDVVCFESDVLPLFQSYCAKSGCHDDRGRDGYRLNNYANIVSRGIRPGDANNSKIYEVLWETGEDAMPPSGNPQLTEGQKILIRRWINQGANNTTGCGDVCDPLSFTYSANIQPMIENSCLGCHGGADPQGGIDLSSYNLLKTYVTNNPARFMGSIRHSSGYSAMPQGADQLSECKIIQLQNWINAGAPNN